MTNFIGMWIMAGPISDVDHYITMVRKGRQTTVLYIQRFYLNSWMMIVQMQLYRCQLSEYESWIHTQTFVIIMIFFLMF